MALAHLRHVGTVDGAERFAVEIGASPYFSWVTGREPVDVEGVIMLGERDRSSELLRADPRGRAVIDVPADAFAAPGTAVQILSYRTERLDGPAASDPIRPLGGARASNLRLRPRRTGSGERPRHRAAGLPATVDSRAMFLENVLGVLGNLLPTISQFVGAIAAPGAAPAVPPPSAPDAPLPSPGSSGTVPGAAAAPPAAPSAAAPAAAALAPAGPAASGSIFGDISALLARPETRRLLDALARQVSRLAGGQSLALSGPRAGGQQYAEAKVFPAALLAALPALMPLLQNVLSPQTIQSVLQTADPNRLLSTITNGIGDLAKIGIQADQAQMEHLRQLNPGLGDDFAERLLLSMSTSDARQRHRRDYRRTDRVTIDFAGLESTELDGRTVVAFAADSAWTFMLSVDTPRPIRRGTLVLLVQEGLSMRPRYEQAVDVDIDSSGSLAAVTVPARIVQQLTTGGEYQVKATLTWPARDGTLGTSRIQLVTAAAPAILGERSGDGELVPLDDVTRDRLFWHRMWATDFSSELRRVDLRVRYVVRLDSDVRGVQRDRTSSDAAVPDGRWELTGTVSSGVRVGLDAIDDLLHRLRGERLDPQVIAACSDPALAGGLDGTAQAAVQLRGRPGEQAAIWVWPEVRMHRVGIHRPATVTPSGQVHSFTTDEITLPFPALIHVLGAST